ncbi:MAG: hypothetical protein J7641_00795 [Cyanobacteria bacterium SID2]|nr:hypothetical protein [Cyanobacteria bacterium SID2]MBP0004175.1 hypothetical protein [Cyanobacteria bacterium SBC]
MSDGINRIVFVPPPPIDNRIAVHHVTREFHREVEYRSDFESYCQWYYETAAKHRQELEKMQGDINILGWFSRSR